MRRYRRSHMRIGCVGAPVPLGRKKGMSRHAGADAGQSASVAQKAEQKPVVMLVGTEKHWRTGATLDFIERSVRAMVTEAEARKVGAVGMPRIGAGYGGLVWNDVEAVLTRACAGSAVRLVVVSLPAATR